uniref:Integrase catalytic domain-containing protein n=2 Tax=Bursaphelenchus xylophilus TaxID=6326 RepID=A0A1I7SH60_BURXY
MAGDNMSDIGKLAEAVDRIKTTFASLDARLDQAEAAAGESATLTSTIAAVQEQLQELLASKPQPQTPVVVPKPAIPADITPFAAQFQLYNLQSILGKLTGREKPADVEKFFITFRLNSSTLTAVQRESVLLSKLFDSALSLFERSRRQLGDVPFDVLLEDFERQMKNRVSGAKNFTADFIKPLIRRPGMPIQEFADKVYDITLKAFPTVDGLTLEKMAVEKFLAGVNSRDVQLALSSARCVDLSYQAMVNVAIRAESVQYTRPSPQQGIGFGNRDNSHPQQQLNLNQREAQGNDQETRTVKERMVPGHKKRQLCNYCHRGYHNPAQCNVKADQERKRIRKIPSSAPINLNLSTQSQSDPTISHIVSYNPPIIQNADTEPQISEETSDLDSHRLATESSPLVIERTEEVNNLPEEERYNDILSAQLAHSAEFDRQLLSISPNMDVVLPPKLLSQDEAYRQFQLQQQGGYLQPILPQISIPDQDQLVNSNEVHLPTEPSSTDRSQKANIDEANLDAYTVNFVKGLIEKSERRRQELEEENLRFIQSQNAVKINLEEEIWNFETLFEEDTQASGDGKETDFTPDLAGTVFSSWTKVKNENNVDFPDILENSMFKSWTMNQKWLKKDIVPARTDGFEYLKDSCYFDWSSYSDADRKERILDSRNTENATSAPAFRGKGCKFKTASINEIVAQEKSDSSSANFP